MLFEFKKGTTVFIGMIPLALPADTKFDVPAVKKSR